MLFQMLVPLVHRLHEMKVLDPSHHFFRHLKKTWMEGDFIDPAAFRIRRDKDTEQFEDGLSVNWVEYFGKPTAQVAVAPLVDILEKKGRTVGKLSKFALLNVGSAKAAAKQYVDIAVVNDAEPSDASHALVKGYEAHNDQVAEELAKIIIATYSAKP
jgi:hypothetical protein